MHYGRLVVAPHIGLRLYSQYLVTLGFAGSPRAAESRLAAGGTSQQQTTFTFRMTSKHALMAKEAWESECSIAQL
jgi:hypothetical protein